MPKVVLTVLAAAMLFGVAISGCNRNRNNQYSANNSGQQINDRRDPSRHARPAEVLAVTVHRSAARRPAAASIPPLEQTTPYYAITQPTYVSRSSYPQYAENVYVRSSNLSQYEPLPEPVPVESLRTYQPAVETYSPSAGSYGGGHQEAYEYVQPTHYTEPAPYAQPHQVYQAPPQLHAAAPAPSAKPVLLSPELALAKAAMEPVAPAPMVPVPHTSATSAPAGVPQAHQPAPLPELEPVRYRRAMDSQSIARIHPAAMYPPAPSGRASNVPSGQSAPAPVALSSSTRDWVAPPLTAMRPGGFFR